MKIAQINGGVFGSTGRILFGIARQAQSAGHQVQCFAPVTSTNRYSQPDMPYTQLGSYRGRQLSVLAARLTGYNGCFARQTTRKLIRQLETFQPDIIHLHNLHDSYVNLPMLFAWLKKSRLPVVWTLHDCWAFTGKCPHFTQVQCEKWRTGCYQCPQLYRYPKALQDKTRQMWQRKREWFSGVENLTLVTPSQWLANLVRESFLRDKPVRVIPNGIDLEAFAPTQGNFREEYGLNGKYLVLAVSFGWGKAKGLDVLLALADQLGENYRLVLVGTDETVEQTLPKNIVSIHRTQNQRELARIYTAADVFVNPTREENYPTVNMEAIACGTPVVTFRTGGSPEILDESCGSIVEVDDVAALQAEIVRICENIPYSREACLQKAAEFDMTRRFWEYIALYEELLRN